MPRREKEPSARSSGWTYRIYTADTAAALFGFTPDVFSASLGPDEVADALREAGAPEPWQNPPIAVGRIDNFVPVGISQAHREVRAALSKLRRLLPDLIEELEQQHRSINAPERFPRLSGSPIVYLSITDRDDLFLYRHISSLLDEHDYSVSLQKGRTADWHANAISILNLYRRTVGPTGISADGPAVTFIEIVLKRLTANAPTKPAIEAAIRSWPHWVDSPDGVSRS